MTKYFTILILFCSINCFSYDPLTCQSDRDNLSSSVANLIKNVCRFSKFDNINFITDANNVTVNSMVEKGYFFIVDRGENMLYMPYHLLNQITNYLGYYGKPLLDRFSVYSEPEQQWLANITSNSSYLVKLPIADVSDAFFNTYTWFEFLTLTPVIAILGIGAATFAYLCTRCICQCKEHKNMLNNDDKESLKQESLKDKDHLESKKDPYKIILMQNKV